MAENSILVRSVPGRTPGPPADGEYLQIGDVAELTGLTQRTLRYYEELQLLDPPTRMAGGFRLYSPADVARLQQIVQLKQLLGFSLAEIKAIIRAEDGQGRAQTESDPGTSARRRLDQITQVLNNTAGQYELVKRKIAEMERLRDDLARRVHDLEQKRNTVMAELERAQAHAASEYS